MARTRGGRTKENLFRALVIAFGAQVAGRLVDLRWHMAHEEFEGAAEQLEAHWLIWISTVFVLVVAALSLRAVDAPRERRGYVLVLGANLAYAVVAVVHFFQHLDHREVDRVHLLLTVTSIAAVIGVMWVAAARYGARRKYEAAA